MYFWFSGSPAKGKEKKGNVATYVVLHRVTDKGMANLKELAATRLSQRRKIPLLSAPC